MTSCAQWIRGLLALCIVICCAGFTTCQTTPIHDYCQIAKPILLAKGEAATLSDESAKEILAHNETFVKICRR